MKPIKCMGGNLKKNASIICSLCANGLFKIFIFPKTTMANR